MYLYLLHLLYIVCTVLNTLLHVDLILKCIKSIRLDLIK